MTADHFDAILVVCRTSRERLIVWLMFGCGLRCVEVSRLDVEDYDPVLQSLHITGKASHERMVPVAAPVQTALREYLRIRRHRTGPLIRRDDNVLRRLGPERISGIAGRLVRDSGVKIRNGDGRSAHGLRAAAASDLYDACLDPVVVQEFLGHASLATVSIYMRRATLEKARAASDKRWPAQPRLPL